MKAWFTSFFGIVTTLALLNVVASLIGHYVYGLSWVWPIASVAFLAAHIFAYVMMGLTFYMVVGGAMDAIMEKLHKK